MNWTHICSLSELKEKTRVMHRNGPQQVAVFWSMDQAYAIDNRCPHEGYPLMQGELNAENCTLTCHWHNWKFDLKNGQARVGQDSVRTYPVEIRENEVWVNLLPVSPEERLQKGQRAMQVALEKRQYGRMTRDIARFLYEDLDPLVFLKQAISWAYERMEFGTTHAFAVAADWLDLYQQSPNKEEQIIALTESLDHIALDVLRQAVFPFTNTVKAFERSAFLAAIEAEDENSAVAHLRGALESGLHIDELEALFAEAALAHFNDFGHSMIYTQKSFELIRALGEEVKAPLLLALTRSLIYATREDFLPEFHRYAPELKKMGAGDLDDLPPWQELTGFGLNRALEWTVEQSAAYSPEALFKGLLAANAELLSRYDESYQSHIDRPVADNAGWLNLTHAITFANAVHTLAGKYPHLWSKGNLQLACFYGRNAKYTHAQTPQLPEIGAHFWPEVKERVLDHGNGLPIFASHLLKTAWAVKVEAENLPEAEARLLKQALARFLEADLKQKHLRRSAKQSLALVGRDYA